ncbi:DUF916 and DUF3324 domain-containing protein [Agrilactobacillus fermenti]|uniref:DUF916 and DUF3324 domain-containing protein n=1 Tax=Agrilactobacillus fermenti TaxID=2586909 RepID=UPI003A5C4410
MNQFGKKSKLHLGLVFFWIIFGVLAWPKSAFAYSVPNVPVIIQPVIPEQQAQKNAAYFDLKLQPGQSVPTNIELQNTSNNEVSLVIKPVFASTDNQGNISYIPHQESDDPTLPFKMADLGLKTQRITLEPNEHRILTQQLTIPRTTKFAGQLLGSFYIWSPEANRQALTGAMKRKHISTYNTYGIYIGLGVGVGDVAQVLPDFRLRQVTVRAQGPNPAVLANLQNFQPQVISNKSLNIQAAVYRRGSSEIVKRAAKLNYSFAPNSNTNIPISWGKRTIQPGNYTLRMTLKQETRTWKFKRNFTVSAAQAQQANRYITPKHDYTWLWVLLGLSGLILAAVLMVFLYRRGINAGKKTKRQSKRKR